MSQFLLQKQKEQQIVSCLSISLANLSLMLPISAIAEVVPYKRLSPVDGLNWIAGAAQWRKLQIPVIDLACFLDENQPTPASDSAKILVFNCMNSHKWFEYFAILSPDFPRPIQITNEDELTLLEENEMGLIRYKMQYQDQQYDVINVEWIESQLESAYFL